MEHLGNALAKLANDYGLSLTHSFLADVLSYISTGDEKLMPGLLRITEAQMNRLCAVATAISRPDKFEEADRRLIRFFARRSILLQGKDRGHQIGEPSDWPLARCLESHLEKEKPDQDFCALLRAEVLALDIPEDHWRLLVARHVHPRVIGHGLTSAGRYLAAQPIAELIRLLPALAYHFDRVFFPALAKAAPDVLESLMDELIRTDKVPQMPEGGWLAGLEANPVRFESRVAAALPKMRKGTLAREKGQLSRALEQHFPGKYRDVALQASRDIGAALGAEDQAAVARWLIEQQGRDAVPAIGHYIRNWNLGNPLIQDWKLEVLKDTVKLLGSKAKPALAAAMQPDMPELRRGALELWIGLADPADDAIIEGHLLQALSAADSKLLLQFIPLAGSRLVTRTAPRLWELIEHKSKPVREAAAQALSKLGDAALPTAGQLLAARKTDVRVAAAGLLIAIDTAAADTALRAHLEKETADDVRDVIQKSLARRAPRPSAPAQQSAVTAAAPPPPSDAAWEISLTDMGVDIEAPGGQPKFHIPSPSGSPLRGPIVAVVIGLFGSDNQERAEKFLVDNLNSRDRNQAMAAITVAAAINLPGIALYIWPLLQGDSKPVREAAADALSKLGDSALPPALELLSARKTETRQAAARLLIALGNDPAREALRRHLDGEKSNDVREIISKFLAMNEQKPEPVTTQAKAGQSLKPDQQHVESVIAKAAPKIKGPAASWIQESTLPPLYFLDGKQVGSDAIRYLLYRQSREKEIVADVEAALLYSVIDRTKSGDFALALLNGYLNSPLEAKERWALAVSGLLGDDRMVPILTRRIAEWAEAARGKLAEYAVQALGLLGSDAALLAVDAMAIRYRTKFKNIGKAASQAFAAAADARGISPAELGDRVVPWLGFEPGKPRVFEFGNSRLEVAIGPDFKLAWRDLAKQKTVKTLPASAPDEVKAEAKELTAALKEVAKAQLLRVENLMVQQRRWPSARWTELFLGHPLMFPFALRLVWGAFDASGTLLGTFRALEDRTLTDALDEAYTIPSGSLIGIVHPLELPPEARQSWMKHLADYNVIPPFPQLERPVVRARPDQASTKLSDDFAGVKINAMTFRGRAERLGWARGSVVDAGIINFYTKPFPAAGADIFLGLEDMYVGIDMYSEITLGKFFFVRHGSVQISGYTYDEPHDEKDPRLLAFADVPAIAFSEAMGDLAKISGKTSAEAGKSEED